VFNFAKTADAVSGPVAIVAVGAEVARADVSGLFQFAAIVNINLAVVNLLPLPVRAPATACGPARAPRPGSAGRPCGAVLGREARAASGRPCAHGWRAAAPAAAAMQRDWCGSLPQRASGLLRRVCARRARQDEYHGMLRARVGDGRHPALLEAQAAHVHRIRRDWSGGAGVQALDGGYLALLVVEAARGRKLPQALEQTIMASGLLLLSGLGFFLILRDVGNLTGLTHGGLM